MWRGQEDFIAVCSIYQINIKMITITGEEDENPVVNIFEPNPELSESREFSAGQVPDMIVLHLKDSHYDLIVPKNSKLAIEGGLDYQREVLIWMIYLMRKIFLLMRMSRVDSGK